MASFTKRAIIESFIRQLQTKPADKITVKDIVEDCGISRNTFYYHFKDIYEVLEEILHMQEERVIWGLENGEIDEGNWREGMDRMMENQEMLYRIYRSTRGTEIRRYFSESAAVIFQHMVEVKARGIPATEKDKELIGRFYHHAFEGCMMDWLESGMKTPIAKELEHLGRLFDGDIEQALRRSAQIQEETEGKSDE